MSNAAKQREPRATSAKTRRAKNVHDLADRDKTPVKSQAAELMESAARYRKVFEENLIPMFVVEKSTRRFVDVNEAACKYYGFSGAQLLDIGPMDFYEREKRSAFEAQFASIDSPEAVDFDTTHKKADGTLTDVHVSLMTIPWNGVEACLATVTDISERNALLAKSSSGQQTLAQSEARYRGLFEQNLTPMLVAEEDKKQFVDANEAACRYYGYSRDDFLRLGALDLYPPEQHTALKDNFDRLSSEASASFDTVHVKADGSSTAVHVTLMSIPWNGAPARLVMVQDLSERDAALVKLEAQAETLAGSEARYAKVFEDNLVPMSVYEKQSDQFLDVNTAACEYYGYAREEFLQLGVMDFHPKEKRTKLRGLLDKLDANAQFDTVHVKADGTSTDVHVRFMPIPWGQATASLIMVQDISESKAQLAKIKSSNDVFRHAQTIGKFGDWSHDLRTGERYWSDEIFRLLGLDAKQGIPATRPPHRACFSPGDLAAMDFSIHEAIKSKAPAGIDVQILRSDGTTLWAHQELVVEHENGAVVKIRGTLHDISDRKDTEARLEAQARIDDLTGLPNRKASAEALKAAIASAKRNAAPAIVLFIDVDQFKNVNDTLGHTAGDELLAELGARMRGILRDDDFVGRMGGDEFVVILSNMTEPCHVLTVIETLQAVVKKPVRLTEDVCVSVSIGIACYPEDGTTVEQLVMNADTAMYHAKRGGRATHRFFSSGMHEAAQQQLRLASTVRAAVANEDFAVWYQPIVNANGHIVGAEALARWPQPDGSIRMPDTFIPYAEESGLIIPLGEWILRTACRRTAQWNAATGKSLRINVNVSPKQVARPDYCRTVFRALADSGLQPDLLEIELTETAISQSPERTGEVVRELRQAGIRVALDDFGTGYNSLIHLRTLEVDTLKLDKIFVNEIVHNLVDRAIATAVIAAARSLGATAVAEGVESHEQSTVLQCLAIDEMQGYLFAKPMTGDAFEYFLLHSAHSEAA